MKKNKMMRLASLVLVGVLMTASAVSGTFAKYVSAGSGTDTARVAKWGVAITASSDIFDTQYNTDDGTYTGALSVESSNTDNVVAPGTTKTAAAFGLTGIPEVATRVTYTLDNFALSTNWLDQNGDFYCPLVFTVNKGSATTEIKGIDYTSAAAIKAAIDSALEDCKQEFAPNTDLSTAIASTKVALSWEWPFYVSDANDVKDTALGNQASIGNAATVAVTLTCTATQID